MNCGGMPLLQHFPTVTSDRQRTRTRTESPDDVQTSDGRVAGCEVVFSAEPARGFDVSADLEELKCFDCVSVGLLVGAAGSSGFELSR